MSQGAVLVPHLRGTPPILAVLTADDVSIGNVEVVRGYQGSALALSQLPVAAVMGMAAPVGDTMPNRCP